LAVFLITDFYSNFIYSQYMVFGEYFIGFHCKKHLNLRNSSVVWNRLNSWALNTKRKVLKFWIISLQLGISPLLSWQSCFLNSPAVLLGMLGSWLC
jgi:hypothetical protein